MSDKVFGIDLGTTYSAVAHISDLGSSEVVPNFEGDQTTPSVVYFESESSVIVGSEAARSALADPDNSCLLIKRQMGTDFKLSFHGTEHTPESISALILRELVTAANDNLGTQVSKVVITVPAYFGIQEKEATKQAGQIAGLEVVGIVTEPVAAALSLGLRGEDGEQTIMVYDLGGGTFDTTIMKVGAGKVEVVAIDGNRLLGGADWDNALVELIVNKFVAQAGLSDDPTIDDDFMIELRSNAEDAKKSLTKKQSTMVLCKYDGASEKIEITREEFEAATDALVRQTIEVCKHTVETAEAKVPGITLDKVLLVGGSSRMPMIENALRENLGWDPVRTDFDLAVAKGAAIYGQAAIDEVLSTDGEAPAADPGAEQKFFLGGASGLSVSNVLSRGLGVEFAAPDGIGESHIGFLVHANDSLPAEPEPMTAGTVMDNQTQVNIKLYEQGGEVESPAVADNTFLIEEHLPIPAGLPRNSPIELTLLVSAEGLARLRAFDPKGGQEVVMEVQTSVMSSEDVQAAAEVVAGLSLRS